MQTSPNVKILILFSPPSGLTHSTHSRDVEQVYLRCSEGSLEWLYPTGALRVNLRTNIALPHKDLTVCIKPYKDSKGSNIYLEKAGDLKLLVAEEDYIPNKVYCFGMDQGALFIQATPQMDISRKITVFQYELFKDRTVADLRNAPGKSYIQSFCCKSRAGFCNPVNNKWWRYFCLDIYHTIYLE